MVDTFCQLFNSKHRKNRRYPPRVRFVLRSNLSTAHLLLGGGFWFEPSEHHLHTIGGRPVTLGADALHQSGAICRALGTQPVPDVSVEVGVLRHGLTQQRYLFVTDNQPPPRLKHVIHTPLIIAKLNKI